jgi:uncharacterized protein with HEPN domain
MDPRDRASLERIVEHARTAIEYARTTPDWRHDQKTVDAIVARVGQVGENATLSRLSEDAQAAVPGVPWAAVRSMRNALYHGYEGIDVDILASTIETDLPLLIEAIEKVLAAS